MSVSQEATEKLSILSFPDRDPFPYYESLRAKAPIHWDEGIGGWALLSDELCRFVETREDLFRTNYADATPLIKQIKGGETIAILTGERHDRARRFHLRLLSPSAVEGYRPEHVTNVVNWLIDRFAALGHADLANDFAYHVPTRMILSMFGMDWQSDEVVKRIHHNHDMINAWIGQRNPTGELSEQALAASNDLNQLLLPYIRERRAGEGSDFISRIWSEAPAEYPDMDEVDALAICRELLLAGADTTMQALANAIYILLTTPELREAIRNDPKTALNNFVEEALRLYPSAQWRFRLANEDIELAGAQVKKNDVLIAVNAAANRDPARYQCPASVDLARDKPTNHATFNVGPRSCAGARLARAEMREVVRAVLTRLPDMQLDPNAPPPTLNGVYMKGYSPLHVRFTPVK